MAFSSLQVIIQPRVTLACTQCLLGYISLRTNQVSMIKLSYRVTAKSHLGVAQLPMAQVPPGGIA